MRKRYLFIHFWRTEAGFRKRMEMLINVLQKRATVERIQKPWAFLGLLTDSPRKRSASVLIYTSLMAPFILVLKLTHAGIPVYYMVRGDEITYVRQRRRHIRAIVAFLFQRLLVSLGCHFVFVCEDLYVLFEKRLGLIRKSSVLPNTLGKRLPTLRSFDRCVALVGDFGTVKNIEWALENLSKGRFEIHLYGNRTLPEKWVRPWLHAHGVVNDLTSALRQSGALVVLPYVEAGLPNVLVEALDAGCGVVVHRGFPFKYLPISDEWRFDLLPSNKAACNSNSGDRKSGLESMLNRLSRDKRDFKRDNPELVKLIESDWEKRVWEVFG